MKGRTTLGAMNCIRRAITAPKPTPMAMAYRRILSTRSYLPAPMFWAPSADTVESMELGTRKRKLMIFSTMPTAAASVRPRWFAMMVMSMKDT